MSAGEWVPDHYYLRWRRPTPSTTPTATPTHPSTPSAPGMCVQGTKIGKIDPEALLVSLRGGKGGETPTTRELLDQLIARTDVEEQEETREANDHAALHVYISALARGDPPQVALREVSVVHGPRVEPWEELLQNLVTQELSPPSVSYLSDSQVEALEKTLEGLAVMQGSRAEPVPNPVSPPESPGDGPGPAKRLDGSEPYLASGPEWDTPVPPHEVREVSAADKA